ncbi:MAG: DNA polymerase III subunit beta [Candidatus Nanopelagicaceae bacterium]
MKFTINSIELSKAIDHVIKFIPAKPLIPILANLKITATGNDVIKISSFDTSNGIELRLLAEVLEDGEICAPAQIFSAIIKGSSGQLVIEVVNTLMTVSNLSGSCEIQCQEAAEYPDFVNESIDKTIQCELDIKTFVQAIKLGGSCASEDASKSILQGVNIVAENGLLTLASTDGHKLVVYKVAVDKSIKIPSSTVPPKILSTIGGNGVMSLVIDGDNCMVVTDSTTVACRSFAGKYPDYPMLLPKSFARSVRVDRVQLIDALNLMSAIGNENSLVKFVFTGNKLVVSSEKSGIKGERILDCELTGDDLILAFNLKYLLGQLKTIPSEMIIASINGPLDPVVIQPVQSELDLLCLLMPVQIRS